MKTLCGKLGNNTFFKHLLDDPLPKVLFLDTSILATAILYPPNRYKKKAVIQFIERLIKEKITIAFSSLLFDEFIHISILNELEKVYKSRSASRKALKKDIKIIEPHIKDIQINMTSLQEILSKFKGYAKVIYPSEPGIISKALELRIKYNLEHSDSIHLSTVLFGGMRDFASFDREDFSQVDGINLWTIYGNISVKCQEQKYELIQKSYRHT